MNWMKMKKGIIFIYLYNRRKKRKKNRRARPIDDF